MEPAEALLKLGLQLLDSGCYPQAAKCLLAVCNSNALPATLATARLLLGQLLLNHTHDIAQSKEHLTAAELILRPLPGNYLLKCETLDTLAQCYQHLGAVVQQREAYASGLSVCRQGAQSKDREALARWAVFFHFKLAEYSLARDSAEDALKAMQDMVSSHSLTPTEQVLHHLSCAFLQLHLSNSEAATSELRQCNVLLDALPDQQSLEARQLRVHLLVLGVSMVLATGSIKDLELEENRPTSMLRQLQDLVDGLKGSEWAYGWMPGKQVEAVVALLHATAYHSVGKLAGSQVHLARAEEIVDEGLQQYEFELQKTESDLTMHSIWGGKGFALLKLLLLQQRAVMALVTTEYSEAAESIGRLIGVMQRFPTLMRDFVPSVSILQGFYAQSMGEQEAAILHFKQVLDREACSHLHPMAAATAALCALQHDSGQAGATRALELLEAGTEPSGGQNGGDSKDGLSKQDRVVQQLVAAIVALRRGETATAKVQLARSLKMAHNNVGNSQLVGTVLLALAPVQLEKGDGSGASALLDSGFTILKGLCDLPSVIATASAMLALQQRLNQTEKLARNRDFIQRKEQELQRVMDAARATQAHQMVLQWAAP